MMCADDDRRGILIDHSLPPAEGFAAHHATGISAKRPSSYFLRGLVDVAHHQEKQIARAKRIALPGTVDWKRPLRRLHMRELGVFARGVNPLAPPPCLGLIEKPRAHLCRARFRGVEQSCWRPARRRAESD